MTLKKTKLLRKNRPRTCELQVSDGRSTGTRTHRVTCEASLPGMDAHPLSLHGDIPPPPLSAEQSVNIPFTWLFKFLIEILNRPEPSTSLEHAWGVPNMLSELWRILFYKVRKKLMFYVFSWLIPHLYLPSHDSRIISHGRERRVSYLSCDLFPRFSHVLISQISWKLLSSGPIDDQRLYFSQ